MKAKSLLNLAGDRLHTLPLVVLYLTDGCNSRCVTCDIWRNPRRNMRMELVENIAGAFRELQVRWVLLSGGEAMQHPQWPEIARRFRAEGAHVMLLTNGLLLRKQIDEVLAGVDEVIVSLDGGTAPAYHAIRGVDAFDLVIDGIRAVRAGGLPVTTRTTIQRANFREIPQIIEVAKAAGVSHISFLTVCANWSGCWMMWKRALPRISPADVSLNRPINCAAW
jgi:MoaA/NifB/PqqE/SkfB family radical SAM enzyme